MHSKSSGSDASEIEIEAVKEEVDGDVNTMQNEGTKTVNSKKSKSLI